MKKYLLTFFLILSTILAIIYFFNEPTDAAAAIFKSIPVQFLGIALNLAIIKNRNDNWWWPALSSTIFLIYNIFLLNFLLDDPDLHFEVAALLFMPAIFNTVILIISLQMRIENRGHK